MLKVGIIGFGGGSALIPVMQNELVGRGVLTEDEFTQDTVIANITPGALPVKLAGLSGARLGGPALALGASIAISLPGAAGTIALLALFTQLGPDGVRAIEFASLGITAFILYLLAHYCVKVIAPTGRINGVALAITVVAFLASGAGTTLELGSAVAGTTVPWEFPQLSALMLVMAALLLISIVSLAQYLRRARGRRSNGGALSPAQTRRFGISSVWLVGLLGVGLALAFAVPPVADAFGFLGLVLASTVTSFGGGEAFVGVADGYFVASGLVESSVFYGQIVPVANALPGPILVKIAAGIALVAGGWVLALAAFLVAIASCTAIALAVLAGYDRASNSLLIRNVGIYILPVICGLLASTALAMIHSNVRIASEAGVPGWASLVGSLLLAAAVPLIHRVVRVPDILIIVTFAAISFALLNAVAM